MPVLQFTPQSSLVQPGFWNELTRLKIDILKLSDQSIPISGSYTPGRWIIDRESGNEIALNGSLSLSAESFDLQIKPPQHSVPAFGTLKNYNTIEEFKAANKAELFNEVTQDIWNATTKTNDPNQLSRFLLLTFADLKKYKYYYWFAFPAFVVKPAWEIDESGWMDSNTKIGHEGLLSIWQALQNVSIPLPYFLIRPSSKSPFEIGKLEDFSSFFANVPEDQRIVSFVDPSASPQNPGWPLRNLLTYLRAQFPDSTRKLQVICWRDVEVPTSGKPWRSRFGIVAIDPSSNMTSECPTAVGWEKNAQGKLGPRLADLGGMMDPTRLADQAVDLNLKLMRWRILPDLNLEKISNTKCLLLGAGTLGCYVSRVLMAWGVRKITLLDSSRVSFSNPVRQPLFDFEDCLNGGKPKAECAAEHMKKIFPGVDASGISLSIPMPGHPVPVGSVNQVKEDVKRLEKLVDEHDAIFLLMDSRESRWLPTVLGAAKGKIVINAALGFDSYLVMRHGARSSLVPQGTARLGCYYCNDIVAPADVSMMVIFKQGLAVVIASKSLTDRTLDQMCTVTRPGLASIAAASAVELLTSLLQHPLGLHAPPPTPQQNEPPQAPTGESVLGLAPHQLRGYLGQFRNMLITGAAYDRCTGCSDLVLNAYEREGFDMLLQAFNEVGYLERLTGLDKLYNEAEDTLEAVHWDEDDDDDL
ncbi:hypothetical protein Clacol_008989 [Clathrus columnatus]|uniref:Ubiquitin-like modifier-activating enzyme ATG7 n=1 Tax=Clathrus columnatus TaxID=1419009 RepID=A0AAV5ALT3_9AGAM|nr:hypothetical protein Clacol_008989 [Clathrus columnatus]